MANVRLEDLNIEQRRAVMNNDGPMLLLAGAGSGKTRVIVLKIAQLVKKGIAPRNILALTFTNKAAKEMLERVTLQIGEKEVSAMWISTFHAVCTRILRESIGRLGYDPHFTILDTEDQIQLLQEVLKKSKIHSSAKDVLYEISSLKERMIFPDECRDKEISPVYLAYSQALKDNNALDFDDLILLTIKLFKSNNDILERYQNRFKYIIVDEYQDTNRIQFYLLSLLAEKNRNICVVGDEDQSIYGFRGADMSNILDFQKTFPDTRVMKLEQNYRCTQTIVSAANAVIKNNKERFEKTLWTENQQGPLIGIAAAEDEKMEASGITQLIAQATKNGSREYSDFAILYRQNAKAQCLERELIRNRIPYKIIGGVSFFSRKEIKDIVSYLKVLCNPRNRIALKRAISVPKRGIGEGTLNKLEQYANANRITLFEALGEASHVRGIKAADEAERFYDLISRLQRRESSGNLKNLVLTIIDETNCLGMTGQDDFERKKNIFTFCNMLEEYDCQNIGLETFLEQSVLDDTVSEKNVNTVYLMTVHSAKGLEFPIVFLAGMEENVFPSFQSIQENGIEEERRLFYVAITRAQEQLILSFSNNRNMMAFEDDICEPSRFISEIPCGLVAPVESVAAAKKSKQRVRHPRYGEGVIQKSRSVGGDVELTISFSTGVMKCLKSQVRLVLV